jgi:hypothetical protein
MTATIIMTHYYTVSLICCFLIPTGNSINLICQGNTLYLRCVVYLVLNYFLSLS